MQDQPYTLAKTKFGKSFGLSLKLGVFYTHFSVCNVSIDTRLGKYSYVLP
jgi:hypothetical protein